MLNIFESTEAGWLLPSALCFRHSGSSGFDKSWRIMVSFTVGEAEGSSFSGYS